MEYRAGELAPPEGRQASGVEGGGFHQGHRGVGVCRRPRGGRPAQAEEGVRLERAGAQLGDARVCRGGHGLPESAATSGPRALDTCPHDPVRRGRADCGTSEDRAGKGRGGGGRGGGWRGEEVGETAGEASGEDGQTESGPAQPRSAARPHLHTLGACRQLHGRRERAAEERKRRTANRRVSPGCPGAPLPRGTCSPFPSLVPSRISQVGREMPP